jgi:hypothetical protein
LATAFSRAIARNAEGHTGDGISVGCVTAAGIADLNAVAVESLLRAFEPDEQLFCEWSLAADTKLRRPCLPSSLIALLGLKRIAGVEVDTLIDVQAVVKRVWGQLSSVKTSRDLGLFIWFSSLCVPERLDNLFSHFDVTSIRFADLLTSGSRTGDLALFLAGVSHAKITYEDYSCDWADLAVEAYKEICNRQTECGIFSSRRSLGTLSNRLVGRFGTFTDQALAVYSLVKFAEAFEVEEPLESATNCANAVCSMQGPLGQWWASYDGARCKLANPYPVLSLHQSGLAPMALFALGSATKRDFREAVFKGLRWIFGENELGQNLRIFEKNLICDRMECKSQRSENWALARSLLHLANPADQGSLQIRHESRTDQLGWLLYALGEFGLSSSAGARS